MGNEQQETGGLDSSDEEATWVCALRFDGYTYSEQTKFDFVAATKRYYETQSWEHLSLSERMTTFFILQRYLGKWGGERTEAVSEEYSAYYSLFLNVCRAPTPSIKNESSFAVSNRARWEREYLPRLDSIEARVRAFHEATVYREYEEQ